MRQRLLVATVLLSMTVPGVTAVGLAGGPAPTRDVVARSASPAVVVTPPSDALYSLPAAPPTTTTTTTTAAPHVHPTTTQPPAPVEAAPVESSGSCSGHADAVAARWPAEQVNTGCRIIACESGGDPSAANTSSSASGIWQALDSTWNDFGGYSRALYAPASVQHDFAFALWQRSGWSPWECS